MTIPDATPDTLLIAIHERSKYGFQLLANAVLRNEESEPLVGRNKLKNNGIAVEPFWEMLGNLEGDEYLMYMHSHPNFEFMVRQSIHDRLVRAQKLLPESWQLVLKAGFRPLKVQLRLLEVFVEKSRTENHDWTDEQHLKHARTFVSDPRIVCPPHVTGGAIDVDVRDKKTGAYIDMGCPPNTDSEISFLHSDLVTPRQYENRMVLLHAMLAAGFAPNPHEWWHYQYGETYWAAFYGHKATLYDILDA